MPDSVLWHLALLPCERPLLYVCQLGALQAYNITCALFETCYTAQVDSALHERRVGMLNARRVYLICVLTALFEVLQVHHGTGRAWERVHLVLAAGHGVADWKIERCK
jgi:hypothetical protein